MRKFRQEIAKNKRILSRDCEKRTNFVKRLRKTHKFRKEITKTRKLHQKNAKACKLRQNIAEIAQILTKSSRKDADFVNRVRKKRMK